MDLGYPVEHRTMGLDQLVALAIFPLTGPLVRFAFDGD
jgi:hypothetical protein